VGFQPGPKFVEEPGMETGTIAYDAETLEILSLEASLLKLPKRIQGSTWRYEFVRVGDKVFIPRFRLESRAKLLMMKRKITMDLQFDRIRPRVFQID
jgi:hypothetical protein